MLTRIIASMIAVASALAVPALAQNVTGTISGSVLDPGGRAVAAAHVSLINNSTSTKLVSLTDERGAFTLGGLLPGTYSLVVSAPGFKQLNASGVVLTASERRSVGELILQLGDVTERVSVSADATAVQTVSAERSGLISQSQITDLALIGRDYLDLLRTLPGVSDFSSHEAPAGTNFNMAIQGNRPGTNLLTIDGVNNLNSGGSTGTWLSPSVDSIAEVKVLLNNYQAEYGRDSGASVNVITKGGGRDFHGGGYYFKRNEAFNANNYFFNQRGQARPRYRYDFGGLNFGGPVYVPGKFNSNRDKLFFFFSQEIMPQSFPNTQNLLTVPTAAQINGDFSTTRDQNGAQVTVKSPTTGQPLAGNVVPASLINADAQRLLGVFPASNYADASVATNYLSSGTYQQPRYETLFRVDYRINDSNSIYVRGIADSQKQTAGYGVPAQGGAWPLIPSSYNNPNKGLLVSLQQTLSSSLIHSFSFGVTRGREEVSPASKQALDAVSRDKLGINFSQFNPQINNLNLIPNATFGGVPNAAAIQFEARYPFFGLNNIWDLSDNWTKTKGTHILKAGLFNERVQRAAKRASSFNGTFDFSRDVNNPNDTGWAYSNALLGVYRSYTESDNRPWGNMRYFNTEWYAQDTWKVTRKLTLDYGLRFSWVQPQFERDGNASGFNPDYYDPAQAAVLVTPGFDSNGKRAGINPVTGQTLPAVLIGSIAKGSAANGMVVAKQNAGYPRALMNDRGIQYGPRFGFAYDPIGDGKTAVRGGFGVTYNREDSSNFLPFTENPPLVNSPTSFYGNLGNFLSAGRAPFPSSVGGVARSGEVPSVMSFSFGVQRQLDAKTHLDVAYAGNLGRHLRQSVNLNGIAPGTDFLASSLDRTTNKPLAADFLRPYPGLGDINYLTFDATSNYNSLQVQVHRRFTDNLQFSGVWTWSKILTTSEGGQVSRYVNELSRYYGPASYDRRHVVSANWIYTLPRVSNLWKSGVSRVALDGWQLSGIFSLSSGAPQAATFSTTDGADITGSPTETARPDLIANPVLDGGNQGVFRYFNTAAFARPAKGTLGSQGKYSFTGPGINNWDIALFKNLQVKERLKAQLRLESYNTFNHTQFSGLDTAARFDAAGSQVNARFGQVISARNPRRLQLGLKLNF
jgi:hypothetical protein